MYTIATCWKHSTGWEVCSGRPLPPHASRASQLTSSGHRARQVCHGLSGVLEFKLVALTVAGATVIHHDTAAGAISARPGLDAAPAELAAADTLIVWRLDRLGRPTVWTLERRQAAAAMLAAAGAGPTTTALGVSRASVYRPAYEQGPDAFARPQ